ncbi:MAG: RNA polymerase sigma factor [Bacteroidales bacterium]|nr:MAG: RNA polymerase sigma factor [Bacteroidales bacterium]
MNPFTKSNLDPVSDTALMFKVKAGDIDKLSLLYERHNKILFGFFFRMSGNREVSEDLVQTVFYRILKNRRQYKGKGKFSSWMFQIAHNLWADHYKKNQRTDLKDNMETWELKDGLSADEQIEREEQLRQLRNALYKLSDEKREVLILSRYQGLKYSEIASILNLTEGAIKIRVFRALAELRKIFVQIDNNGYEG